MRKFGKSENTTENKGQAAPSPAKAPDRDLKHLSREELLELLVASEKHGRQLEEELAAEQQKEQLLQEQAKQLQDQLAQRQYDITEAGNLAEAVLKVNGVCEAAQKAATEYLENIKNLSEQQEAICAEREAKSKEDAYNLMKETTRSCEALQKKTEEECWNLEETTKASCEKAKAEAKTEVEQYWAQLSTRLEQFYQAHEGMKEILSFYNMKLPKVGTQN